MCEISSVSFHSDIIFIIDYHGEPFTPMKPIVENMGLAWQSQLEKLSSNKTRWGITIIVIPSDGGEQKTVCMPLRKLPAYLASINPNKVRAELRPKIELYQNESDDALWNYWMNGRAERNIETSPDAPLTPDQQCTIQALVKARIEAIPENIRPKGLYPQIYSRFNNHFRLGSYKQLPQKRMSEAVTYLAQLEVKPLEIEEKPAVEPREIKEPLVSNVIGHDIFAGQQRIFEECAEVSRHLNIIKGWLHPTARPGARPFNMNVEKQVLYDNMDDLVTVAMCNVWALENAVKAFGRIGARVDFRK